MGLIKRWPADKYFSLCVRCRSDWTCEKCGKQYPEGHRQGLHCSHLISRANKNTRWCADAAFAHCYGCHQLLGSNPIDFVDWAISQLGEGLYEIVKDKSREQYKGWKHDLGDISQHYRSEYRRMEALRNGGVTGRIEFTSWN